MKDTEVRVWDPSSRWKSEAGFRKKERATRPNAPETGKGSPSFAKKRGLHVKRKTPKCHMTSLRTCAPSGYRPRRPGRYPSPEQPSRGSSPSTWAMGGVSTQGPLLQAAGRALEPRPVQMCPDRCQKQATERHSKPQARELPSKTSLNKMDKGCGMQRKK